MSARSDDPGNVGPSANARRRIARGAAAVLILALVLAGVWRYSKSRTHQPFGDIVPRVDTQDSVIALTFDDGPWYPGADTLIAIFEREGVRATFFLVGDAMVQSPADARKLAAAGHELGNHSMTHNRMIGRTPGFIRREVEGTDSLIRAAGQAGEIHFRPPYGSKLFLLPWYLERTGRKTIMWDVEPDSYADVRGDSAAIVEHVRDRARPGSIIILHPWGGANGAIRKAIPGVIREMKALGYAFVTVSELLDGSRRPTSAGAHALQTDSAAYTLRRDGRGWAVNISARYRNDSPDTVYVVNCNGHVVMFLQRRTAAGWTDAWRGESNGCLSAPIVIPPGTFYATSLPIWGAEARATWTNAFLSDEFGGEFRLVWHQPVLHYDARSQNIGDTLPLARRASNPFVLLRAENGAPR